MTPARPAPAPTRCGETLAYYRDLGVAELYLDERAEEQREDFLESEWGGGHRRRRRRLRIGAAVFGKNSLFLRHVPPVQDPQADGVRGRLARGPDHVHRRGARSRRGRPGRAVRGSRRPAPHADDRGRHGPAALVRLHRERPEVPSARKPEPGAGRDRLVPRLPRDADRPREARGARRARQVRRTLPPRNRGGHHAPARKVGKLSRHSGDAHVSPVVPPPPAGPEEGGVGGSPRGAREARDRATGVEGEAAT